MFTSRLHDLGALSEPGGLRIDHPSFAYDKRSNNHLLRRPLHQAVVL